MRRIFSSIAIIGVLLATSGCRTANDPLGFDTAAPPAPPPSTLAPHTHAEELLNHLAGDWKLTGTLGGKETTHDVVARWVLNHEYLTLHETSRERATNGQPAYEAIVLLSAAPSDDCSCLWLDTTSGAGLSNGVMGRGKVADDSIPFVFDLSHGVLIYNTFLYSAKSDSWQWTIESVENGKREPFGHVTSTGNKSHSSVPFSRHFAPFRGQNPSLIRALRVIRGQFPPRPPPLPHFTTLIPL